MAKNKTQAKIQKVKSPSPKITKQEKKKEHKKEKVIVEAESSFTNNKKVMIIRKDNSKEEKIKKTETKTKRACKTEKNYNIDKILDQAGASGSGSIIGFCPMLAESYDGSQEINNWMMSEKLDGVRCIWDGKRLYSRNGNQFFPPDYFKKDFPSDMMLDGELFMARNMFSETISIVKKKEPHDGWKKIKFMVFDAPKVKQTLKKRFEIIKEKISKIKSEYLVYHEQEICKNKEQLEKTMDEIVKKKGEGVIIRDPNSLYEERRVKTMLKVKRFHDAEATVIAHNRGTGRCEGMLGALVVKNDDGVQFKIGSGFDDSQRLKPPKIGSRVTYRYFELSKDKVPRFPTFVRVHPGM